LGIPKGKGEGKGEAAGKGEEAGKGFAERALRACVRGAAKVA
jgi:hypothetical protein